MSKKNTDGKPMSKAKYAFNVALVVLQVAIVIVAIAFSISILLSTGYDSATDFGDSSIRLMPVLTDSMNGDKDDSFAAGDLIIVKKADADAKAALKVGDIITYLEDIGTTDVQFVTHRIVDIEETASGEKVYYTMGDAETSGIRKAVLVGDIQGIYVGKLAGVGSAVFWLQDPTHFFLVIMLPLIVLLLYNAYLVVRIVIDAKLKKQREQLVGATSAGAAPLDEEEIKRRAIEEYIKQKAVEDYIKEQSSATDVKPAESVGNAVANEEKATENDDSPKDDAPDNTESVQAEENAPADGRETEKPEEQAEIAPAEEPAPEVSEDAKEEDAEADATEVKAEENSDEEREKAEKTDAKPAEVKKTASKSTAKTAAKKTAAKSATAKKPQAKTAESKAKKPQTKTAAKNGATKPAAKKPAAKKTTAKK